jgi:hypothetical protein
MIRDKGGEGEGLIKLCGQIMRLENIEKKIRWLGVMEVRNRHKGLGKGIGIEAQIIWFRVKENFVR